MKSASAALGRIYLSLSLYSFHPIYEESSARKSDIYGSLYKLWLDS